MLRISAVVMFVLLAAFAVAKPMQTFTVREYLGHQWTDELVHFPVTLMGILPASWALVDAAGTPMPYQLTNLTRKGGTFTGTLWTVISLPPKGTMTLTLQPGAPAQSTLHLVTQGNEYLLGNEHLTLRLPRLGMPAQPVDLATLPAPLLALSDGEGKAWYGQGTWVNPDGLQVKSAATTVLEEGPVRVTVRYRLDFTDGRYYQADIALGARQDAALFTDDTNVNAPQACFRFAVNPGLGADRVYWNNTHWADREQKGLTPGALDTSKEQVLCRLRPWSYWWAKDYAIAAGFYKAGAEPFLGVMCLRPSRWTPYGWDGFDRTPLPVTARQGGGIDLTLPLLAMPKTTTDPATLSEAMKIAYALSQEALAKGNGTDAARAVMPQHRDLAFTVGRASANVCKVYDSAPLHLQCVKYSQFPLDEVKDYGFDYPRSARNHPYLLFTQAEVDRVRRQAKVLPQVQAELARCAANGLAQTAFLGSDDPKYGKALAAQVKQQARDNTLRLLESPWKADLGGLAHVYPGSWTNLIFAYDTIASTEYLTAEEKRDIEASIVFGAHVIAHPDYWNPERGLCSANPNMTALVRLPRGLLALFLEGHPESARWLNVAETELRRELDAFITMPDGAWIENPGYQGASLDPILTLMQAMKNVAGRDYFVDPRFKATMEYYGFLHMPPDRRFPPNNTKGLPSPMIFPSIGDMTTAHMSPYTGWVAKATATSDPAFSARQQFFWKGALCAYNTMYTAGYTLALTDPELPAAPPARLTGSYPGFGNLVHTSWTDPKASYLAHRTGPNLHHYHDDFNSIEYAAKGAPLVADWGNGYSTAWRSESWYHNRVSFNDLAHTPTQAEFSTGHLLDLRDLPRTLSYSTGISRSFNGQQDTRHALLVKSDDPLGATYLVVRDVTQAVQPGDAFYWNLFCIAKEPEIAGNLVHFPGQLGVDLDVHLLSPAKPEITKDSWKWSNWLYPYGNYTEEDYGIHVKKTGAAEDFLAVLYPRAAGQMAAKVSSLGANTLTVTHAEGSDVLVFSPQQTPGIGDGVTIVSGKIAFARTYTDGRIRLATVLGSCAAETMKWSLQSDGPTAIEISGTTITGESSGAAHTATITMPVGNTIQKVLLDGKPMKPVVKGTVLTLKLPAGAHTFKITLEGVK
jgi:hypothetical protein